MVRASPLQGDDNQHKSHKISLEQKLDIVSLYNSGVAVVKISEVYSISRQSTYEIIRKFTDIKPNTGFRNSFFRGGPKRSNAIIKRTKRLLKKHKIVNPETCSVCYQSPKDKRGISTVHGHHDDYNKPLEVRWLCRKCHFEWHRHNMPIPYRGFRG